MVGGLFVMFKNWSAVFSRIAAPLAVIVAIAVGLNFRDRVAAASGLALQCDHPSQQQQSRDGSARFTFSIRNVADVPVQIVGAQASCSCIKPRGLPITVAPRCTVSLEFDAVDACRGSARPTYFVQLLEGKAGPVGVPLTLEIKCVNVRDSGSLEPVSDPAFQ